MAGTHTRHDIITPPGPNGLTAGDYFALPDDGKLYELINGKLLMSPSPIRKHQIVTTRLAGLLLAWVEEHDEGSVEVAPLDFRVNDTSVLQPDILWLPKSHPQYRDWEAVISSPPGMVVEVLSPGGGRRDYRDKFAIYEKAGVPHYWIADPEGKTIEAWALKKGAYVGINGAIKGRKFSAPPFPKLSINLDKLFAPPK